MRNDLKDARSALGLTQQELADLIEKDQGTVSRYETGAIAVDASTAPRLASVLGIPILQVLYGDSDPLSQAAPQEAA